MASMGHSASLLSLGFGRKGDGLLARFDGLVARLDLGGSTILAQLKRHI